MLADLFGNRHRQQLMMLGALVLSAQITHAQLLSKPLVTDVIEVIPSTNTALAAVIEPPFNYQPPPPSICDFHEEVDSGFLCAIQPSRLDSETRDVFSTDTYANRTRGFGYHAMLFPNDNIMIKGVYIHFGGSFSRPFNPMNNTFPSATLLKEAADVGFIAIQLAYNNRFPVSSSDECSGPAGASIDDCAGSIRRDKTLGGELSLSAPTPIADSIEHRLTRVVEYFDSQAFDLPIQVVLDEQINWPALFLGGHSQGAAQALYIGKYYGAKHVCMLAGSYDVPDAVPAIPPEGIADWFLDASTVMPHYKVRAVVAENDQFFDRFLTGYAALSLKENWHWRSFYASHYFDEEMNEIDGHGAAVRDPSFAEIRRKACFTQQYLWSRYSFAAKVGS